MSATLIFLLVLYALLILYAVIIAAIERSWPNGGSRASVTQVLEDDLLDILWEHAEEDVLKERRKRRLYEPLRRDRQ